MSPRTARVVPYVEDRKNCLLFEPADRTPSGEDGLAAGGAEERDPGRVPARGHRARGRAAAERDDRRFILFYESAEGGAGVLRRLVDDPTALAASRARRSSSATSTRDRRGPRRRPRRQGDCEAACYDCLMSYRNQPDHQLLDRQEILGLLLRLAQSGVSGSPVTHDSRRAVRPARTPRGLRSRAAVAQGSSSTGGIGCRPTPAKLFERASTRPDFFYDGGPRRRLRRRPTPTTIPDRAARDVGSSRQPWRTSATPCCGFGTTTTGRR